jgi:hypothetical protein
VSGYDGVVVRWGQISAGLAVHQLERFGRTAPEKQKAALPGGSFEIGMSDQPNE